MWTQLSIFTPLTKKQKAQHQLKIIYKNMDRTEEAISAAFDQHSRKLISRDQLLITHKQESGVLTYLYKQAAKYRKLSA